MILTTTFVQGIFVSFMSVHVPWCFKPQPSLISVAGKFAEKGVVIIARLQWTCCDYKNLWGQHADYDFGIRNREQEKILDFCAAIIMTVVNRTFRKRERHLVIYEFDSSKKYVDYCVVMKNQTKFVKRLLKSVPTDW